MAALSGRRAVAGNAPALRCMTVEANAGHTRAVRPAFEQQAVTMLFLQLNPWSFGERQFIFNYLRSCFTRYTTLIAEFVFYLLK